MIELAALWVLSLQLLRGGEHYTASFETEHGCVAAGERLYAQARKRAIAAGKRPPPGWICTTGEGQKVRT